MIRVEITSYHLGYAEYTASQNGLHTSGKSRQPLLYACRELKRMGIDPEAEIGLFWPGSIVASLTTTIGAGANTTVSEPSYGGIKFAKYKPYPPAEAPSPVG